jgi:hypothetical protein
MEFQLNFVAEAQKVEQSGLMGIQFTSCSSGVAAASCGSSRQI